MGQRVRRVEVEQDRTAGRAPSPPEPSPALHAVVPASTSTTAPHDDHAADVGPPGADVPSAEDTARALGLCVVEILTGVRDVDSIARWITEEVHRHLQHRVAVSARARSIGRHRRSRPVLRVGGVVTCSPADGVVEATVVVHARTTARAVAIRLEERQGRWRATAVGVL